jgi:hypothetical protein
MSSYIEKRVKLQSGRPLGHDLSRGGHHHRRGRGGHHSLEGHPDLRGPLRGPRAQLPLPTRITIAVSKFLGRYMWLLVLLTGAGAFSLFQYHKTYRGKRQIDQLS